MKVTILTAVESITAPKKDGSGNYTKHTQEAVLETKTSRVTMPIDVPASDKAWPLGEYTCDVESQLKPGRFGYELPRYYKLVAVSAK